MTPVIGITLLNNTLSASPLSSLFWELNEFWWIHSALWIFTEIHSLMNVYEYFVSHQKALTWMLMTSSNPGNSIALEFKNSYIFSKYLPYSHSWCLQGSLTWMFLAVKRNVSGSGLWRIMYLRLQNKQTDFSTHILKKIFFLRTWSCASPWWWIMNQQSLYIGSFLLHVKMIEGVKHHQLYFWCNKNPLYLG